MSTIELFATCPKGLESLLLQELQTLGASQARETVAGVYFTGDETLLYSACLWSRLANKILLPLAAYELKDEAALYQGAADIAWESHLSPDDTFRVDFVGTNQRIRNSQFGALRIKDALVDRFQQTMGERPSVDKDNPAVIINAYLNKDKVQVSLDLSGQSLHRRAYRQRQGLAPIKENLACAILQRASWPDLAEQGAFLLDPMCGSATFLIEGCMMAADIAPGLLRPDGVWGFAGWKQFNISLWQDLIATAKQRKTQGLQILRDRGFEARGYDRDWRVLQAAESNIQRAGLEEFIRVLGKPLAELTKPTHKDMTRGLLVTNPPYGERLGEQRELEAVYQELGQVLRQYFVGWTAAVITSNQDLAKQIGISHQKKYKLWNGSLAAECLLYSIQPETFYKHLDHQNPWGLTKALSYDALSEGATMVCNRLKKNQKQLKPWLKRERVQCYRVYDADIPEYAAAIDCYGEGIHVQEYAAPKTIDETLARKRFDELLDAVCVAMAVNRNDISIKQRRRNKGKQQYERLTKYEWQPSQADQWADALVVGEAQAQFLVDLWSYLDTGLFLDHRPLRKRIGHMAKGKTFLNLFCYTATATVHAALGGAESSVSVDMSKTYINWAKANFQHNNIKLKRHQLIQQDCLSWLQACRQGFDLIFLDPPSFSNSKRMDEVLDIQRDHVTLIKRCMDILLPGGTVIFSTNLRSFTLDEAALTEYRVVNITDETIDPDFQRNRKIHQCWELSNIID